MANTEIAPMYVETAGPGALYDADGYWGTSRTPEIGGAATEDERRMVEAIYAETVHDPRVDKVLGAFRRGGETETLMHLRRSTKAALFIGARMGLDEVRLGQLARGMAIHDGAKIYPQIRNALDHPGGLSESDKAWQRLHPAYGADLARSLGFHGPEIGITGRHHMLGRDPYGLTVAELAPEEQDDILVAIAVIADNLDGLCSPRIYRPDMMAPADTPDVIQRQATVARDFPEVWRAFISLARPAEASDAMVA